MPTGPAAQPKSLPHDITNIIRMVAYSHESKRQPCGSEEVAMAELGPKELVMVKEGPKKVAWQS